MLQLRSIKRSRTASHCDEAIKRKKEGTGEPSLSPSIDEDGPMSIADREHLPTHGEEIKNIARLRQLAVAAQECFTDWFLGHRYPPAADLLGPDGSLALGDIVTLLKLERFEVTRGELVQALQLQSESGLIFDEMASRIRSTRAPNVDMVRRISTKNWNKRMLYVEKLPPRAYLLDGLRVPMAEIDHLNLRNYLGNLFSCSIDVLRLPMLDQADDSAATPGPHQLDSFPFGGGDFKGFCFVVLSTVEAAEQALSRWPWRTDLAQPNEGPLMADTSLPSEWTRTTPNHGFAAGTGPTQHAHSSGLRVLSFQKWVQLKSEYMRYYNDIISLESNRRPYTEHGRGRRRSDGFDHGSDERTRRASREDAEQGWHKKESMATRWEHEELPEAPKHPLGCLLFVDGIHPNSKHTVLKSLFGKLVERDGAVRYVDYVPGTTECYVRFSSTEVAEAAVHALKATLRTQDDGDDDEPEEYCDGAADEGYGSPYLIARLLDGTAEALYWQARGHR
ncbi:uncharacterized protein L969DRAFT_102828 [Mixia osmundae IAM 14324]|uniref:XRRM domain-containing protein n=1 Tax=Mixia osmundae (strain CBS 9802 / IAM 14324 / JCM 22182 / KY 12970) TaxID=764103 RepID=G7EA01_MIXOS|nr:uncharacterized protein L969DRAFT_102828 [Mixia osmundae IAM 14324]KEI40104.1 hypothetical protein L969DRAFT_102828 [Mixia osmundae IAM 14324]GAA99470.1 hypothetical protein E5Q_06169 [Mixia osmundae IAM 14324]